ncbi:MAG: HEPN domain-containing protein [Synergistetes bacterium]|nr:MAG: HEPN domain protein [bacterium 42_11]MBC7331073.1 HEPN domain-containing protein [Synergistota bacterium]MDK2871829.1 hypothetical protein [bacterium]
MNRWKDWYEQAKRDLERAKIDVEHRYYEWACFTCQQATEKVIKALGMKMGLELWGHSLLEMLKILEEETEIEIPQNLKLMAKELDKYYIPTRYPNGFPSGKPADYFSEIDAERAINAANSIFRFCESIFNK